MTKIPLLPAPKTSVVTKSVEQNPILQALEPQYKTFWGCLSFDEIYGRSYRYSYSLLYRDHRFNPDNIEDGLQVGYLKLWQRLEKEPDLLAELNIAWLGKFIFNAAFHTRHRDRVIAGRNQQTSISDNNSDDTFEFSLIGSGAHRGHSHESRQIDTRIDLERAIATTAQAILQLPAGKEQDRNLWALYGITALQVQVTEMSQLFSVNHRGMKRAYSTVQLMLQDNLKEYTPRGETRPIHNKGRKAQPHQDIRQIRMQTANSPPENFEEVRKTLQNIKADTLDRDLLALEGIRVKTPARQQARNHGISYSAMQRAYERVHLLLAVVVNPTISPRQAEKKHHPPFTYQVEDEAIIQLLANELLNQSNSQERLVAFYAYLCNLPNRTTARNFQMNEATLRRYRQQSHERILQLRESVQISVCSVSEIAVQKDSIEIMTRLEPIFATAF